AIALLLTTLQSFHFRDLNGAIIPYVGLALLLLLAISRIVTQPLQLYIPRRAVISTGMILVVAIFSAIATGESKNSLGLALSASALVILPIVLGGQIAAMRWALRVTIL